MAEAYGKLTGTPGLAFVTRGPGATNAAIGIHTAAQDSTPHDRCSSARSAGDMVDREAFQEIDYRPHVRQRRQVGRADRSRRAHSRIRRARLRAGDVGTPGPVVLALPEDMLTSHGRGATMRRASKPVSSAPSPACAGRERARAARRRRASPLVIVGGSRWDRGSLRALMRFAQANALPVACAFRHQDLFDNRASALRGRRRHRHQSQARRARARRRRAARDRRAPGRDDHERLHAARRRPCRSSSWSTCIPRPTNWAACTSRRSRSRPRPANSWRDECAAAACRAPQWRERRRAAHARLRGVARPASRFPATSTCGASCSGWTSACPTTPSSPTAPATTRCGCIACSAIAAFAPQLAPYSGAMGYGVPAAVAAKAVHPDADRRVLRGTATAASS